MAVTDAAILEELQYAVLEPPDAGVTWTSGLWTQAEVLAYLNQQQNRMLRETLLLVGEVLIAVGIGSLAVTLPADWLRTVRVVWRGADGVVRPLFRSDSFAADQVLSNWATANGVPLVYMDEEAGTLTLHVAPASDVGGKVELTYVPLGDVLAMTPSLVNVPDECVPGLKYGVLAKMLGKEGRGRDEGRAEYAQERYDLIVEAIGLLMEGWVE